MTRANVLLFEPDPEARRQVADALRAFGHTAAHALDAEHALALIHEAGRFDMVVVAIGAEHREAGRNEGVEVALRARSAPGPADEGTIVLFLVAPGALASVRPMLAEGTADYLQKPLEPAVVDARIAVLDRLLRERAARAGRRAASDAPAVHIPSVDVHVPSVDEDALKRSEERFRTLYSESPIGILLYDGAGQPIDMNPSCMRIFGVESLAQIPNMFDCFRIFPEPEAGELARKRLESGGSFRYEFPVNFEHGIHDLHLPPTARTGTIYVDLLVTPLAKRLDGQFAGFLVQVQEVTDRRLAEQSLTRAYQNMRKLLDSVPECIAVHRGGKLLYVNAQGLAWFGHASFDEVSGKALIDFLRPDDIEAARQCLDAIEASQDPGATRELRVRSPGGEIALLEVTGGPAIEYEGGPALMLVARDVSERKKLEARLLVADRMASLGTLSAGVAHEINNPLSYVMANVSHVSGELTRRAEEEPEAFGEIREALDEALVGVDRIRRIVADLKTFSRPDDERAVTLDIRRVLDSSANMAANEIRHRARLIKEYTPVPPVRGSDARLGQVFLNLLVNAAQALPVGHAGDHEIRLRAGPGAPGRVVIEVVDTGPGIPPEILPRIFDPFFTTKPVGEGTGLGLSICHAIVKALGGEITVDSVVGRGTTVRVSLPSSAVVVEDAAPGRAPREKKTPRRRVLVIDDEPLFASAIRRLLQSDHDVTLVESGSAGVALMLQRDFDVVLCDLMMPEVSGMDVYNEVQRARPGLERRMAFMTGGAFTQAARQFLDAVPNARLDKPFSRDEIRAIVHRTASGDTSS